MVIKYLIAILVILIIIVSFYYVNKLYDKLFYREMMIDVLHKGYEIIEEELECGEYNKALDFTKRILDIKKEEEEGYVK